MNNIRAWDDCPSCAGRGEIGVGYTVGSDIAKPEPIAYGGYYPCPTCLAHFKAVDLVVERFTMLVYACDEWRASYYEERVTAGGSIECHPTTKEIQAVFDALDALRVPATHPQGQPTKGGKE